MESSVVPTKTIGTESRYAIAGPPQTARVSEAPSSTSILDAHESPKMTNSIKITNFFICPPAIKFKKLKAISL